MKGYVMTTFTWGTVTATSPLRVQLDGDTSALSITPDSLINVAALTVGNRVRCELSQQRVVIHGVVGGGIPTVPTGTVEFTVALTAPTNWLLCDGSAVSRTTYAALFSACGVTFGAGDGSTTFNVPNLAGKVIAGVDTTQAEFAARGQTGGEKTHLLTTAEMPSHTHAPDQASTYWMRNGSGTSAAVAAGAGYAQSLATAATGGGGAHNNLQPYIVLTPIIKT